MNLQKQVKEDLKTKERQAKDQRKMLNNDNTLMNEVAKGSKASFSLLLERYMTKALTNCRRFFSNERSEEITQDVFLKIWINAPSFNTQKGNFKNWFYKILFNTINSSLRKSKNTKQILKEKEYLQTNDNTLEKILLEKETNNTLNHLLQKLPKDQRSILILKYYENYSHKEISKIMGKTIKSVENIISKAKKNLNLTLRRYSL